MLYELRIYAVPQGREADICRRMVHNVPPLFAQHGIRDVAYWVAETGPKLPAFYYLLEFDGMAEREAAWNGFYADPEWWRIRQATNAGAELVENYSLLLLKPAAAWPHPFRPSPHPVQEMLLQRVQIGASYEVTDHLRAALLPSLRQNGAEISAVLNVVAGPDVPSVAIFVGWPDHRGRRTGWAAYERLMASKIDAVGPAKWHGMLLERSAFLSRHAV